MKSKLFYKVIIVITLMLVFSSCSTIEEKRTTESIQNKSEETISPSDSSEKSLPENSKPVKNIFPDELTKNVETDNQIFIEADKNLAESEDLPIREWELGKIYPVGGSIIGNNGKILVANTPYNDGEVATVYLANVETKEMKEIHKADSGNHVYEVYHDDEIIVFYEYEMWTNHGSPITYFIYNQKQETVEIMDIREISIERLEVKLDNKMARIDDDLFFEAQYTNQIIEENEKGYDLIFAGVGIHSYNMQTKEVEYIVDGFEPRALNGELVFVQDNSDKIVKLNGDIIAEGAIEYETYKDSMVINKYAKSKNVIDTYYYMEGKEELIFSRDASKSFWNYGLNDKYITWWQTTSNLYVYSLEDKEIYLLSSNEGTRIAEISDKYIFWQNVEYDEMDIENAELTLEYIKFE